MSTRDGWQMRLYLALRPLLRPVAERALRRRLKRGKEDPARMGEKQGRASLPRPEGALVWIHAVGLGEVLALRPLIAALQQAQPGLQVLVTSTARSANAVFGANLPPNVLHQSLPLDVPQYTGRFLDHWRPDLAIWSEQDLWPGLICDTARRGVPMAYVNARMNDAAFSRRRRARGLYRDMLRRFALIAAQDAQSAAHIRALSGREVQVMRSLKPSAAPLAVDVPELAHLHDRLAGRRIWVAASTHPQDEVVALQAQAQLFAQDPSWLLILAPRLPARAREIAQALESRALPHVQRSAGRVPGPETAVWLADTFGEMGLWYRLAARALIGGSFGPVQGHNPWEAICLGLPVLHGPQTANFASDYATLHAEGLAQQITPETLPQALQAPAPARDASALIETARADAARLARDLLALMAGRA
ncbi:MAG: 3-deoxy-D-manno-octulosonic acid transferase [Natronohydrobacter sp.]|nr:3-deoxy-D-manno-octulosonic acid transferase [Natronohydrobacter sp.]